MQLHMLDRIWRHCMMYHYILDGLLFLVLKIYDTLVGNVDILTNMDPIIRERCGCVVMSYLLSSTFT